MGKTPSCYHRPAMMPILGEPLQGLGGGGRDGPPTMTDLGLISMSESSLGD